MASPLSLAEATVPAELVQRFAYSQSDVVDANIEGRTAELVLGLRIFAHGEPTPGPLYAWKLMRLALRVRPKGLLAVAAYQPMFHDLLQPAGFRRLARVPTPRLDHIEVYQSPPEPTAMIEQWHDLERSVLSRVAS